MRWAVAVMLGLIVSVSVVHADDIGEPDTCRLSAPAWYYMSDSVLHVDVWGWIDDPLVNFATFGFKIQTFGKPEINWAEVDSQIYVDTFIFDPDLGPGLVNAAYLSIINDEIEHDEYNWGYNGFAIVLFSSFDPLLTLGIPVRLGECQIKIADITHVPDTFMISIDSTWFPESGTFKYKPRGSGLHVPQFVRADINVNMRCYSICIDSDGDCYGDPGHPENECPLDNCPDVFNPDQTDSDGDGIGNACEPLCGDCDDSGEVDVDDVIYAVSYIFSGGPPPDPFEKGDANCSSAIDIDDAIYLVQYIFAGGPDPCDPSGDGSPDC
jgi:hypothetical protein